MREQFLATDLSVFAAEAEGFGEGKRIRASLGALRAQALLVVGAAEDPEGEAAKVAAFLPSRYPARCRPRRRVPGERVLPHVLRVLRKGFGRRR